MLPYASYPDWLYRDTMILAQGFPRAGERYAGPVQSVGVPA